MGVFRFGLTAALAALALCAAAPAWAVKVAGPTKAVIIRPLSLVKTADLDFGTFTSGATAGTVAVDPATDARTTTGGVTGLTGGTAAAASRFVGYGNANNIVQVTRGALPVLTRAGGGATMNVTALTLNGPTLRVLTAAGGLDLRVGGTLAVGANQLSGTYNGAFTINVDYF